MKLKILRESTTENGIADPVGEVLSETCSAFGHRLNVGYGLIGKGSEKKYGVPLTQDVIDECAEYDGTLVLTGDEDLACEISDALNVPVLISEHARDIASDGKRVGGSTIAVVQSLDEETVSRASRTVQNFALVKGTGFTAVKATGRCAEVWKNTFLSASLLNGSNRLLESDAPQAIRKLLREKDEGNMFVLPPAVGAIFRAAAEETVRSPLPVRRMCCGDGGVYFCMISGAPDTLNADVLSSVLSCADFLEFSCHLFREAACIRTGVYNVTRDREGGMAVPEEKIEDVIDKVCSQISLAGRLVGSN